MKIKIMLVLFALLLSGLAQANDDLPVVAILRYGGTAGELTWSEFGVLEMLLADGFITAEERQTLEARADLEGERISIFWGDAGWDLANANLMVDDALGREADALITLTTPVTRAAVNATSVMDEPPPVLFASAFNPIEAGIADSACDKPANITGSQILAPYAEAIALLQAQNPDLSIIGVISSSSEISGIAGGDELEALAAELGIGMERAAVSYLSDFPVAAQALADDLVDAIIAPIDAVTAQALPVITTIANESGIPFLYPVLGAVYHGATFGIGFTEHYQQGLHLGRLLTGYLNGDLDIANTAIRSFSGDAHSVNLDAAAEQGISIQQALIDSADIVLQDGADSKSAAFDAAYATYDLAQLQSDELRAEAAAMMAELQCGE